MGTGWDTGLSDTRSTCCVQALLSRPHGVNRLPWALPRLVPPCSSVCIREWHAVRFDWVRHMLEADLNTAVAGV